MSVDKPPQVVAIVVTWNSADVIAECLNSVRRLQFDGEVRTIVVDNDSSDRTTSIVAATDSAAQIVQTGRNAGYAAAINAGIRASPGADAYFLLNPDSRVDHRSLQLLLERLDETGAGIVVPRLVDQYGSLRFSLRREPTARRAWGEAVLGGTRAGLVPSLGEVEMRRNVYQRARRADWSTGAAMLVSRRCADAVGEWDESYFLYSEETDFALRARDAGFALEYVPDAVVVHHEGDSHQSPALFALLEFNRVKFYRSRHSRLATAVFWAGVVAGDLVRFLDPARRAALRPLFGDRRAMAAPGAARSEARDAGETAGQ
ncbi:glycosyltransferase family 2 protein [Leifsonia sp. 2MCAF36]|uniref:glycosyltransferase family 2 protein n=1 Tax=Leifsonia sp. 2MCAF36 TaxID=3232988 RepID=UPI003F9E2A3E